MKREDTAKLLAIVTAVYPSIKIVSATLDAWHELLEDLPTGIAKAALKAVLQKQVYPTLPTIGAIRQEVVYLAQGRPLLPALAFQQAQKWAVGDAGLDPVTLEAAKAIGGWELKVSENPSATRAQFIKVYEAIVARKNEEALVCIGESPAFRAIEGGKQ